MRTLQAKVWRGARAALLAGIGFTAIGLAGCEGWLDVSDPGAIETGELGDTTMISLMVNGVVGDFQQSLAWTGFFGGIFTDELRNHHGYFENGQIDRRDVSDLNGTYIAAIYNGLHRARHLAESSAERIKGLLGPDASSDLRLARILAYGGYSYVLLGEQLCATPINRSAPVPSDELLGRAIALFDEAIAVAQAAAAADPEITAQADSLVNFARVGAARAALDRGDNTNAVQYASAVTPAYASDADAGFEFFAYYLADGRRLRNPFWEFSTDAGEQWVSISGTPFDGLNATDPRVPAELRTTVDGTTQFAPNSPSSFSTFDPTLTAEDGSYMGAPFEATTTIRVASALEARYIIAEANGLQGQLNQSDIDFLNERAALGGAAPAAPANQAEYLALLRDQRRRDLFLDAHRLGDLRRYKALHGVDEFPSGSYFGTPEQYGTQECWPIPATET